MNPGHTPIEEPEGRFRFLTELADATYELHDPDAVAAHVVHRLGEALRAARCTYAERAPSGDRLTLHRTYTHEGMGPPTDEDLTQLLRSAASSPAGPLDLTVHGGLATLCYPLASDGWSLGLIAVQNPAPHTFSAGAASLLSAVAARVPGYVERARSVRALADSERTLRRLADVLPQIVWSASSGGRIDYYNQRWVEYTGSPPGPTLESSWYALVHPDDLSRAVAGWRASLATGHAYDAEFRVRHKEGDYRWMRIHARPEPEPDGRILRWFGTGTDIDDTKSADQAIGLAREHMKTVVKAADVGIWYCPLPFDRLVWDDKVKEHFHLPPEAEVDIARFYAIIHPEDRERTRRAIEDSIAARRSYDIDYRTVSADGQRTKWIRAVGRAYYDTQGSPIRFDGITSDITQRKQTELALRESERERTALLESERAARIEAERASRMKDEFLATLSHELRTPLNAILGWAQLIQRGTLGPAEQATGLGAIERNSRAQAQIVDDLLDMSRLVSGKLRLDVAPVDLAAIVRAAVETCSPAAHAKGITLRTTLDPRHDFVFMGDANRLHQVLWNLLGNAVKFTPRGGHVDVHLARAAAHLELRITDSGEGILPEFMHLLFNRFSQADASFSRRHGGLGIGLSIVKQLVELHGGTVQAHSEGAGLGATFIVTLPIPPIATAFAGRPWGPGQ